VVPNTVTGSPIAGHEGLNRILGLVAYSKTQANPSGLKGVARFSSGEHSSLLSPTFPAVTAEMQGQMVSFIASGGQLVIVANSSVLIPVAQIEVAPGDDSAQSESHSGKSKNRTTPVNNQAQD
ncbi:MAG: hypothetical protein SH820_16335, partial [Xanthomonadales bacterium]|nr:hypothetical protein [Xanthomonadales bacterium]